MHRYIGVRRNTITVWHTIYSSHHISDNLKIIIMGNLLYVLAVILIVGWLLGMFAFNAGGFIHILLVIAVIIFLVKLIGGNRPV